MPNAEQHDYLRLHRCPKCGYDLTGLPREGKCPECGFAYDTMMFSLLGRRSDPLHGWGCTIWLLAMAFTPMALNLTMRNPASAAMLVAAVVLAGAILWRFIINHRQRTTNSEWLLFTAEGIGSRQTEGDFRIIHWQNFKRVTMQRLFTFRRRQDGIGTWEIRLFREPRFTFFDPNKRHTGLGSKRTGGDISFRVQVTEAEATRILDRLRECFTRGWKVESLG